MKIVCPNCSTTYEVGATNIAPGGRDVRCSRCGTTWRIDSETIEDESEDEQVLGADDAWDDEGADEEAAAFPDEDGEADGFDTVDDRGEDDEEDPNAAFAAAMQEDDEAGDDGDEELDSDPNWAFEGAEEEQSLVAREGDGEDWEEEIGLNDAGEDEELDRPQDVESAAERRRKGRKRGGRGEPRYPVSPQMRAAMGLTLFASSIILSIAMITLREPIVRAAPNLADLYAYVGLDVNLRGLEFRDLRTFREYEKGAPVLIVEGTVENVRPTSAHVPAIRLALRSGDSQEIYAWTVEPRQLRLRAGQTLRFSTRLASPPDVAADVLLRFTDRTKRQTDI